MKYKTEITQLNSLVNLSCAKCGAHEKCSQYDNLYLCRHCLRRLAVESMEHYILGMYRAFPETARTQTREDKKRILDNISTDALGRLELREQLTQSGDKYEIW